MWDLEDFTKVRRWYALHIVLGVTFFVSSLIINAIQFLLYITIRPINKSLYRQINYYLMYSVMSQIMFLGEWWSESEIKVYCNDETFRKCGKESSLCIMNHTCEVDWLMGWVVADRFSMLGAGKVFAKNMMKYIPTIGWAWSSADIIFLNRNWKKDKETFYTQVNELFDYPYPVWLLLFCEGTRFTTEKHATSMKFAREKGIPELKHLLLPRSRGFVECVRTMRGNFEVIYDVTVAFNTKEGAPPTLLSMLRGEKVLCELYMKRIKLKDVPSEEEQTIEFLHQLYRTKDSMLDSYYNTGNFWKQSGEPCVPSQPAIRRYFSLLNMIGWTVVVVSLISVQYYRLLTTGSLIANSIAAAVILLAYVGLYKLIGLTKISKGSKYGDKPT